MTFAESIPIAKRLAERQLEKGFDVEAFLILSEISKMDAIPDSNVDEHISDIGQMFIEYYYNPSTEALEKLCNSFILTISEIYNTIYNVDDKNLLKTKIQSLINILN